MKAGWQVKALGEVCEVKPAKSLARKELSESDLVSFVPMGDLGELEKLFEAKQTKPLAEVYGSYVYFAENDVLVAKITPCFENGKLGIARGLENGVGFGSSEFVPIRPSSAILPEFIFYFLYRDVFRVDGAKIMSGAVGHKRVPEDYIRQLPIPLPPLAEQKQIVAVLDAAFEGLSRARAHTEANLQNARELFGTAIQSLLEHEADDPATIRTTLGAVCEISSGAGFPDKYQGNASGEFPFFKVGDMNRVGNEVSLYAAQNYISEDVRKVLGAKVFRPSSIVFPKVGGAIATNKKRKIVVPSCVDNNVMGLWPVPDQIDPEYLFWWLQGFDIYEFSNKAALPSITKTTVSDWPLVLPSKDRQKEIAGELRGIWRQTEDLQSHYRAKLADLDALRQSLLQKAFAGELT